MIKVSELRNYRRDSDNLNRLQDRILETYEQGEKSFNYYPNPDLTEIEKDIIRESGYNISWNSACFWYEISW